MSKLTRTLQATAALAALAALAAPGTAAARPNLDPMLAHSKPTPETILAAPAAPAHVQVTVQRASAAFDWGDAALGAGTTLFIVGAAGAGAARLRTRRRVRPQMSAS